jgi:hypothetical protein
MNGKQLPCVFARVLAVLSEFVPIALLTFGIEIPKSSRWHGTSHSLGFSQAQ